MAQLMVALQNKEGLRLSVSTSTQMRSTAAENEARQRVEASVNANEQHAKHGPWTVTSSIYTSG